MQTGLLNLSIIFIFAQNTIILKSSYQLTNKLLYLVSFRKQTAKKLSSFRITCYFPDFMIMWFQ